MVCLALLGPTYQWEWPLEFVPQVASLEGHIGSLALAALQKEFRAEDTFSLSSAAIKCVNRF